MGDRALTRATVKESSLRSAVRGQGDRALARATVKESSARFYVRQGLGLHTGLGLGYLAMRTITFTLVLIQAGHRPLGKVVTLA